MNPLTDLEQYATAQNADAVQLAVDRAAARAALPEIEFAGSFVAEDIPEPPQLVWGMLHAGSKFALAGASKAFKTWSLLNLAVAVSTGKEWLGFKTFPGRVLFINFELPRWSIQRRLKAIARAMEVELDDRQLCIWNLRGYSAPYQSLIPRIVDRIRGEGFSLVEMDPLYKMLGEADENSASDIARLLNSIEQITECGPAVAFGAHYSKGNQAGKNSIDRISGSGVFARDPDSILTFTAHEEPKAFTVEPTLRNFEPVPPFVVRWEYPLMRRVDHLNPERLKQPPKGRGATYNRDELLGLIAAEPLNTTNWQEKAKAELGIGPTRFYEILAELKAEKAIHQPKRGLWLPNKTSKDENAASTQQLR
jgi:hypothetical protein